MDFSYFPPVGTAEVLETRRELLLSAVEKALAARLATLDGTLAIGCGPLPDGIEDIRLQVTRFAAPVAENPHLVAGKAVLAGNSPAAAAFRDRFGRLAALLPLPCPEAVAIDGAENAALLAVQILSVKYPELRMKMKDYKVKMEEDVIRQDRELRS